MLPGNAVLGAPLATPRASDKLHVTFVQMGGTIDKDYPRSQGGYAFEVFLTLHYITLHDIT